MKNVSTHLDLNDLLFELKLINAYAARRLFILDEYFVKLALNCVFGEKFFDTSHHLRLFLIFTILLLLLLCLLRWGMSCLYVLLGSENWHRPDHFLLRYMVYYEVSLLILSILLLLSSYEIRAVQ